MELEYIVGLVRHDTDSHALKSHRARMQNPGLNVVAQPGGGVRWTLLGLHAGVVEAAEAGDVDHLDFYIFRDSFVQLRGSLLVPTVAPGGGGVPPTFPWGTEGAGKPPVRPGTVQSRFPVESAAMRMAQGALRATTGETCHLNIDFQAAPYPNPSGGRREQVHFEIDAAWSVAQDRRIRNNVAIIEMSMAQYADVYHSMMAV